MSDEPPLLELFPGLPPSVLPPPSKIFCTKTNYQAAVRQRWRGGALHDALHNWKLFETHRETFLAWCIHFKSDPQLFIGQKAHNPDGTLRSMVWVMQRAIQPDRSYLEPCLDFEDHFQTCFIRRGLIAYLTLLLKELES